MTATAVQTLDEVLSACPEWCDMDHAGVWDDDIQPTYHQTEVWLGPENENQAQVTLTIEPEWTAPRIEVYMNGPGVSAAVARDVTAVLIAFCKIAEEKA